MFKLKNNKKQKNEPLSNFSVFTIIVIVIVIILGFLYLSYSINKKIVLSNIESMKELALHDAGSIRNSISLRWDNMEGVAKEIVRAEIDNSDDLLETLKAKTDSVPSAERMSLVDSEGRNFISNGVVENNTYLSDVCKNKTERFVVRLNTKTYFRENLSEVILLGIPVDFYVDDEHFKWFVCQFPIDTLENELKIRNYGDKGYTSVIDEGGNYIINISRNHSFMAFDNFFSDIAGASFEEFDNVEEVKSFFSSTKESNTLVYKNGGTKNIMVIMPFDMADWYFITTVPMSVFVTQTKSIIASFSVLIIFTALILISLFLLGMHQRRQRIALEISDATNKSKTEFLFNMSHDIRTPMNAILGYTDIAIKHSEERDKVDDSLAKIKVAGEHLLNLINDILEMSRIESGKLDITEEPMNLCKVIEGVGQMSSSLAIEKSIEFNCFFEEIKNPYVYSDALHINEVLINLISNAIKYTADGGKVSLEAKQEGDVTEGKATYIFEVSDNGIGMSEEFQKHLFEAFSRENTSTVSHQEGAGLGLSIVKRILDISGGTISVASQKGEGSTFTVRLPLRVMDKTAIREFEEENKPINLETSKFSFENKKVLLVEDNEMNREIAKDLLEDVGIVVDTAMDGEFAVREVLDKGTGYYDLILMDIQMPVMDGYSATKVIRELPGGDKVIIIALSANAFEEDIKKSLKLGMNAHVAKPIDVKVLFETMQRLV